VIAAEEDVVDGVAIAAVWACGVVTRISSEVSRVAGVKGMAGDELEQGGLVCVGLGGENPIDEWVKGCVWGFSQRGEVTAGSPGGGGVQDALQSSSRHSGSGLWTVCVTARVA
jgi:hypothetical protein